MPRIPAKTSPWKRIEDFLYREPAMMAVFGVVGSCVGILYPPVLFLLSAYVGWAFHQTVVFDKSLWVRVASFCAAFLASIVLLFWLRSELEKRFPLPESKIVSLFEQTGGSLWSERLRVLGNPKFKMLKQSGGTAVFDDTTVETEEHIQATRSFEFQPLSDEQLRRMAEGTAVELNSLSEKYKVNYPEVPSKEIFKNYEDHRDTNEKAARSLYERYFSKDTRELALEIENRTGVKMPDLEQPTYEAYQLNANILHGRMTVMARRLGPIESASWIADYLNYIASSISQK